METRVEQEIEELKKALKRGSAQKQKYIPLDTLRACAVCRTKNMIHSPDGVTCGYNLCRDRLPEIFQEVLGEIECETLYDRLKKVHDIVSEIHEIHNALAADSNNIALFRTLRELTGSLKTLF